jgi:hypothetical protein
MTFSFISIPSLAVNKYLWHTMKTLEPSLDNQYGNTIPFYPIGDSAAGDEPWDNKPYIVYDRVFRFSSKPFYEHKRESTLYYLKAREIESLTWSAAIQMILDREDDSAKDINAWIRNEWYQKILLRAYQDDVDFSSFISEQTKEMISAYQSGQTKQINNEIVNPEEVVIKNDYEVYFHNLRIYQSRSSSPSSEGKLREFSTVQPYYITEFMVDTHFHFTKTFDEFMLEAKSDHITS